MYDTTEPWRTQRFDRWYHLVVVGLMLNAVLDTLPHGTLFSLALISYSTLHAQKAIGALWFRESNEHVIVSLFRLRYGVLGFVVGLRYLFVHLGQF